MLNINNMSGYNDDAIYSEVADNAFELKKNDAIYSEVTDKAFELKKNRCYSDVQILSLNKTKAYRKDKRKQALSNFKMCGGNFSLCFLDDSDAGCYKCWFCLCNIRNIRNQVRHC